MMRLVLGTIALMVWAAPAGTGELVEWAMNATAIEACSCPMFCQCYFNTSPAAHHGHSGDKEHYCRFNMGYKINSGHYGATKLDGARFWITGDLGPDYSQGQTDWAVVTFDKAMTQEQRDGLVPILGKLFPVQWKSLTTSEGTVDTWTIGKDSAHATLDGGRTAEIKLTRFAGMTDEPIVIKNLKYWAAPRNDGFVLFPNEVQAYRVGDKAFEFKNSNGFLITVDISSKDFPAEQPAGM